MTILFFSFLSRPLSLAPWWASTCPASRTFSEWSFSSGWHGWLESEVSSGPSSSSSCVVPLWVFCLLSLLDLYCLSPQVVVNSKNCKATSVPGVIKIRRKLLWKYIYIASYLYFDSFREYNMHHLFECKCVYAWYSVYLIIPEIDLLIIFRHLNRH